MGAIRLLLGVQNINVNIKDYRGRTPLMYAVESDNAHDKVKLLLGHDELDVNATIDTVYASDDNKGKSSLHLLCENNTNSAVGAMRLLVGVQNINVNIKDSEGRTPLMYAVESDNAHDKVQLLLGRDELDVNATIDTVYGYHGGKGKSSLHLLCENNTDSALGAMRLLLGVQNINVNIKDSRGRTPLMYAVVSDNADDKVKLLLGRVELDINATIYTFYGDDYDEGKSSLHLLCENNTDSALGTMRLLLCD